MLFSKKWEEVYCTSDQEAFFRAKYILDEQGISFKTDLINNQLRLSFNNADGLCYAGLGIGGRRIGHALHPDGVSASHRCAAYIYFACLAA